MSGCSVHRYPPLPRFDPACGENPFSWILRAAEAAREQRRASDERRWVEQEAARRAARKAGAP